MRKKAIKTTMMMFLIVLSMISVFKLKAQNDLELILEDSVEWNTDDDESRSVCVEDVDSDSVKEIITAGWTAGYNGKGQLKIWRFDGTEVILEGVREWATGGTTRVYSVCTSDVDSDGAIEIITGGLAWGGSCPISQLRIYDGTTLTLEHSEEWSGTGDCWVYSVSANDVDGDGSYEIVTGGTTNGRKCAQLRIWSWNGGTLTPEASAEWSGVGGFTTVFSACISDIDGDGSIEIVTGGTEHDGLKYNSQIKIWNFDGTGLNLEASTKWSGAGTVTEAYSVSTFDVDNDGTIEILAAGETQEAQQIGQLRVLNFDGASLSLEATTEWSWMGWTSARGVESCDINSDGIIDIITAGFTDDGTHRFAQLRIWNGASLTLEKSHEWLTFSTTYALGVFANDLDDDEIKEIITCGVANDGRNYGQLRVWSIKVPADFNIKASPLSRTIMQSQSTSYDVIITFTSGTAEVNLKVEGLPSGATYTFDPPTGDTTFKSKLRLDVSSMVPPGKYALDIIGEGGGLTKTCTVELVVAPLKAEAFMTDSDFNLINSFDVLFTRDKTSGVYKLTATNPGTYIYNLKISNVDTSLPGLSWTKYSSNPLLTWPLVTSSAQHSEQCVLFDGVMYKMWYCDTSSGIISYAQSTDGVNWEDFGQVLGPGPSEWESEMVSSPSVIFNGTHYLMWYHGYVDYPSGDGFSQIGFAWSRDGLSWTRYGDPVLTRGSGKWDTYGVIYPAVLLEGSTYKMWYMGRAGWGSNPFSIGYANSTDGIHWKRHNEPVISRGSAGEWDDKDLQSLSVVKTGSTYLMWYGGRSSSPLSWKIGLATSNDGISWQKCLSNPVLDTGSEGSWDSVYVIDPSVVQVGNIYKMWYVGYDGSKCRGGLAYSGPLQLDLAITLPPGVKKNGAAVDPAFLLKGSMPIHIYNDDPRLPNTLEVTSEYAINVPQPLSTPYTSQSPITITGPMPNSGVLYVTIHLDFALKGDTSYDSSDQETYLQQCILSTDLSGDSTSIGPFSIPTIPTPFTGVGKKMTAIGGFAIDTTGAGKNGLTVEVYDMNDVMLKTAFTTTSLAGDGWYFISNLPTGVDLKVVLCNSAGTPVATKYVQALSQFEFREVDFLSLNPADPTIEGYVTDGKNIGFESVRVQLFDKQGRLVAETTTSFSGHYAFSFSQPGTYIVKMVSPNGSICRNSVQTVSIKQFQIIRIDFIMAPT